MGPGDDMRCNVGSGGSLERIGEVDKLLAIGRQGRIRSVQSRAGHDRRRLKAFSGLQTIKAMSRP